MRYFEIVEADATAQANAQHAQRGRVTAANDKVAKASQTYQASEKTAHASAAAAKKKLATPRQPASKLTPTTSQLRPLARPVSIGEVCEPLPRTI